MNQIENKENLTFLVLISVFLVLILFLDFQGLDPQHPNLIGLFLSYFSHVSVGHLVTNLFFLWFFGILFVLTASKKSIVFFLFIVGLLIGLAQILIGIIGTYLLGPWTVEIGEFGGLKGYSGVIMGIATFTLISNISFFKEHYNKIDFSLMFLFSNFIIPIFVMFC